MSKVNNSISHLPRTRELHFPNTDVNFEYLICAELKNNDKKKIKECADWSKQNKLATRSAIKAGTKSNSYYSFRRHRGEQLPSRNGWLGGLVVAAAAEGGCLGASMLPLARLCRHHSSMIGCVATNPSGI